MYEWDLGFRLSLLGSHYISTNLIIRVSSSLFLKTSWKHPC